MAKKKHYLSAYEENLSRLEKLIKKMQGMLSEACSKEERMYIDAHINKMRKQLKIQKRWCEQQSV